MNLNNRVKDLLETEHSAEFIALKSLASHELSFSDLIKGDIDSLQENPLGLIRSYLLFHFNEHANRVLSLHKVVSVALAIELIVRAQTLHSNILDSHATSKTLIGDMLLSRAYVILTKVNSISILKLFVHASEKTIEGEVWLLQKQSNCEQFTLKDVYERSVLPMFLVIEHLLRSECIDGPCAKRLEVLKKFAELSCAISLKYRDLAHDSAKLERTAFTKLAEHKSAHI